MIRPENLTVYQELDLKLGIKSSLPHVKSTLALAVLLWECADHPAELQYSEQNGDETVLAEEVEQWLIDYLSDICEEEQIDPEALITGINQNQLFKSQIEALIVAFELIWKLAKVNFVDTTMPASSERSGGVRYPKKLTYSVNADIIHSVIASNENEYVRVLMSWIGFNINCDPEYDKILTYLFTALSEGAVFKLSDDGSDVIFNQNSVYKKVLETTEEVDINGDKEAKGSLRILKSLLADGLNPYLQYSNGSVTAATDRAEQIEEYQKRVETLLRLSATKVIGVEEVTVDDGGTALENPEEIRVSSGTNVLLYGVPGSGKSWTIEHEYCKPGTKVERLVFHPDYTNADFVGQILPVVDAVDKQVTYEFTPGPFTNILKAAYTHPQDKYVLIIEEINRGNAPAIFGDVFQLLDRTVVEKIADGITYPAGTSEYGITNENVAKVVYGDSTKKVRIPSNLSILGTMNTSDQNVFTLDTAFQRRWHMRLIENNFNNVRRSLSEAEILDTHVTWKRFCETINTIIIGNKAKMASAEDKRLGVYFIHENDLSFDERALPSGDYTSLLVEYNDLLRYEALEKMDDAMRQRLNDIREAVMHNRIFPEKVIKYLWDDAFKFNPEALFNTEEMDNLEKVIRTFVYNKGENRFRIFKSNVREALFPNQQE